MNKFLYDLRSDIAMLSVNAHDEETDVSRERNKVVAECLEIIDSTIYKQVKENEYDALIEVKVTELACEMLASSVRIEGQADFIAQGVAAIICDFSEIIESDIAETLFFMGSLAELYKLRKEQVKEIQKWTAQ